MFYHFIIKFLCSCFLSYTVKPVQTITSIRRPMLSPPMQIPIQSLLYKTTTCPTRPATNFLSLKWKKDLFERTTTKLYPAKKWETETNMRQQCIKNKGLSDCVYCITTLWCKMYLMFIKSWQCIKLFKIV